MTQPSRHIASARQIGAASLAATAWLGCGLASAQTVPGTSQATPFGTSVPNVATISYELPNGNAVVADTNEAVFVVSPPNTPATIEFFRFAPTASFAVPTVINGSDFAPSGDLSGPFEAVPAPTNPGGVVIDTSQPVPLIPAETYLAGEVMFVEVEDQSANRDAFAIDTVVITIEADNGDIITLRLYETGPNTGIFYGHVDSTRVQTPNYDPELTTGGNTNLVATYTDVFDATDVVIDSALVDPLNRVFSSLTGELVSGATVTLIDSATGAPATTFGVDGFSVFPASQVSGSEVVDGAGLIYELDEGEFRFPDVPEGAYSILVDPPDGFTFSSVLDADAITALDNGSFVITDASYGDTFRVDERGPLRFDIPLDPETDLVVSKAADTTTADVGDFVAYTVTVENRGLSTVPLRLHDTLPIGFRYLPGTSRLNGAPIEDPDVDPSATALTFQAGTVSPGESVQLRYALRVGAGAHLGDAVNRAMVLGGNNQPISNIARAEIALREDLLRSTSTLVGRVSENSCDGEQEWARDIVRGDGVAGVRLYTETGAYTVTDADGLYHFQGLSAGVHAVQVDLETLPEGYSIMTCEESTRYAGRNFSKFVDVQGGGIWRANFYLERTGDVAVAEVEERFDDQTEYKTFDAAWLEDQTPDAAFVYPAEYRTPSKPSVNLGIKHRPDQTVRLLLNGLPVNKLMIDGRLRNTGNSVMLTRWRGVDVLEGPNTFTAEFVDADGTVAEVLERRIDFVRNVARASAVPDLSTLVADGYTVPKLAVRLEDEAGRPVHAGRMVDVDILDPYLQHDPDRALRLENEAGNELIEPLSARESLPVGEDGILHIPLEPTLRTGKATAIVTLDTGRQVPLSYYLEPEKRDWIVVGLAEGTVGLDTLGRNMAPVSEGEDEDILSDGRVAFFAKGLVKGEWLLTLAVDTDQRRTGLGNRDGAFRDEIDPNAYYTLYGDRSYQQLEGVSRYPLYVKLEKRQGYALFGDFDTDIREGRLTAYNRRLSGLKAEYVGEDVQVTAFGAETNQGFALDEIAADGTSGTYQLDNARILPQSEEIVIETRDRVRPDVVLDRRVMVRYLDYTLDYFTGQLIFRLPVDVSDSEFNPNVIVASYETSEEAERNLTFGGRAQVELMDDRARIGVTGVREDGSDREAGVEGTIVGVDAVFAVSDSTEARAEFAVSEDKTSGTTADAILAEVVHTSEDLQLETYYRRQDAGFGLGQRTSNTDGAQRYGVRADYTVSETENVISGRRVRRSIAAAAYREDNLATGDSRSNAEITARQDGDRMDMVAGLRVTNDELIGREDRTSVIATGTALYRIPDHGANVSVSVERPLGGSDEVSVYPARTVLGLDKTVGDWAVATLRHEFLDGNGVDSTNTTFGLSATPWRGGSLTLSSDYLTQDASRRLGATVGLDQQVRLSDRWSASAGLRNRRLLDGESDAYVQVAPDAAISPLERNEDFTSGYMGVAYRNGPTSVSGRLEGRSSTEGDTYIATAAVAREISETLSLAGAARGYFAEPDGSSRAASRMDARLGVAWRPRDENDLIVFNRLDVSDEKSDLGLDSRKLVNNVAVNTQIDDRWQLTANWGTKYVQTDYDIDGARQELSSWSNLVGAETRYDLTRWLDVGARAQAILSEGDTAWSFGPSVGVTPVDNVWVSLGYNFDGYVDEDFEAAEYSRSGPYIQIRFKFDQDSTDGLLRRISPRSVTDPVGTQRASLEP